MTGQEMWKQFSAAKNIQDTECECWAFGEAPDKLAQLVAAGIKTGTASAFDLYALEGEALPQVGEYSVILDSKEQAVCIIRTTKVYVAPFNQVGAEHAYKEGEGDKTLEYWKKVHREFFTSCMEEAGLCFSERMKVVCEEFELVYRP